RRELFVSGGTVRTKVQDSPPAKYMDGARVSDAIVSSGCIIRGTVENSVIFRGVTVEKGAFIKNSIVMQGGSVGAGAVLENVISDKYAAVSPGVTLIGAKDNPVVIG
ncbi:MAG: glucose-1-phosphate adenylyltransferase subunit GlgD, partial [Oscillospiraceae bacterium]|nr:glucose-1-phosphate adenylyltransferase subunit GlgD [Oscillospiraceae bacterium]